MLGERLGVSERRACRITGQHRSTQRHQPRRTDRDAALRTELRELSRAHPRWGYRKAWAALREQGWETNRKKIQRLWREEGLRVPRRKRKRQRIGSSTTPAAPRSSSSAPEPRDAPHHGTFAADGSSVQEAYAHTRAREAPAGRSP